MMYVQIALALMIVTVGSFLCFTLYRLTLALANHLDPASAPRPPLPTISDRLTAAQETLNDEGFDQLSTDVNDYWVNQWKAEKKSDGLEDEDLERMLLEREPIDLN